MENKQVVKEFQVQSGIDSLTKESGNKLVKIKTSLHICAKRQVLIMVLKKFVINSHLLEKREAGI